MPIKKLVVEEFEIKTEAERVCIFEIGDKYTYFKDPETGKYYVPKTTFQVTGENLENLFEEFTEFYEEDE